MEFLAQNVMIEISKVTGFMLVIIFSLLIYLLFSAFIKINILRYELIRLSDWSASKLEEISTSATEAIVSEVLIFRTNLSRADAEMYVPEDVVNAVKEWEEACDRMQASLIRNGMKPLTVEDSQFTLSPYMK
jgi:hypothetical protein